MILNNLSKVLDKYEEQLGYTSLNQFEHLKDLPFYNWFLPQKQPKLKYTFNKMSNLSTSSTQEWKQKQEIEQKEDQKPFFKYQSVKNTDCLTSSTFNYSSHLLKKW